MNADDLLQMLDLAGADAPPPGPAAPLLGPACRPPEPPAGPTALALDDWSLRRGRELLAESGRLQELGVGEFAAADFLAAAYLPDPELAPACADPLRREFVAQLLAAPDYRALHAGTALCEPAAAVAAAAFAARFAALKQERGESPDPGGESGPVAPDPLALEMAALGAAARAAADAGAEVAGLRDAAAALGLGPGSPGASDPAAVAALFKRVRSDPGLRRVCDLAGRFRRVAQSKQMQKAARGDDDVVGVTTGGDVGRLLAGELARLADPEFELEALRRIVEHAALCREHRADEPAGKGPVVVVVDESGSMQGGPAETAKALALALCWAARRQRRWAGLVAYSGDSGERLLALPPGRWDERALADWVCAFIGGGSSLDLPVRELPDYFRRLGAPPGAADVVFVTDAACRIPPELAGRFNAWRRSARARVVSLVVGGQPGDLTRVSDECHLVAALSPDDPAVGRALSL